MRRGTSPHPVVFRLIPLCLALLWLLPAWAAGQRARAQDLGESTTWRQQNGSFGAMLLLTRQPGRFLTAWDVPARPGYEPEIRTTEEVARGEHIVAFVVASGCQGNDSGLCDSEADFTVLRPDGSVYGEHLDSELWKGQAPAAPQLQLGVGYLGVRIEPDDPLGTYMLRARACDRVAQRCVDLERSFEVRSPQAALDLDDFLHFYYEDPRPVLVESALRAIDEKGVLADETARPPLVGFFAQLFSQNPDRITAWTALIAELSDASKGTLQSAMKLAKAPAWLPNAFPVSASRNDLLWGAFFASGDPAYLSQLVAHLAYLDERTDLNLFLTGASAQWSLCANAQEHPPVAQSLREAQQTAIGSMARAIADALSKDPAEIRAGTIEILQQQKAAGIWK